MGKLEWLAPSNSLPTEVLNNCLETNYEYFPCPDAGLYSMKVPTKCSIIYISNIHHESHIYFLFYQFLMKKIEGFYPPFEDKSVYTCSQKPSSS